MRRIKYRIVLPFWLIILSGACSGARVVPSSPTPRIITLAPADRVTLPPTWTPIPTDTPLPTTPPSATPSPEPTLTVEQICSDFSVLAHPGAGAQFDYDGQVTFAWRNIPNGVPMVLTLTLHGQKAGARIDVNAAGDNVLPIPLTKLPQEGEYDWRIWLQHPQYGEICVSSGSFIRKPVVMM